MTLKGCGGGGQGETGPRTLFRTGGLLPLKRPGHRRGEVTILKCNIMGMTWG